MPLQYFYDEEHISEWLNISKTDEGVQEYLDKYVFAVKDHAAYRSLIGGQRLQALAEAAPAAAGRQP